MEEAILRGWSNLVARLDGPLHFRFIVQPAVAILLAIRAAVRDARGGKPPFLLAVWKKGLRREGLRMAWSDIRQVFLIAALLDAVYQVRSHRSIYLLELLFTATLLALVPYGLIRGPATRMARVLLARRDSRPTPPVAG